jgi:hypothetical protein
MLGNEFKNQSRAKIDFLYVPNVENETPTEEQMQIEEVEESKINF